jgi:hypothetical protein
MMTQYYPDRAMYDVGSLYRPCGLVYKLNLSSLPLGNYVSSKL